MVGLELSRAPSTRLFGSLRGATRPNCSARQKREGTVSVKRLALSTPSPVGVAVGCVEYRVAFADSFSITSEPFCRRVTMGDGAAVDQFFARPEELEPDRELEHPKPVREP